MCMFVVYGARTDKTNMWCLLFVVTRNAIKFIVVVSMYHFRVITVRYG